MVKENRFSKYMLYAIGEIVLVVIGILIARCTPLIPKGPTTPGQASKCYE